MVPVLCSPSTGQTLVLPKVKTSRAKVKCLLGYDPLDKQFKVLSAHLEWNRVKEWYGVWAIGTQQSSEQRPFCFANRLHCRAKGHSDPIRWWSPSSTKAHQCTRQGFVVNQSTKLPTVDDCQKQRTQASCYSYDWRSTYDRAVQSILSLRWSYRYLMTTPGRALGIYISCINRLTL